MNLVECLALFALAALATMLLVPAAKRLAVRFDAIDYPSARRVNKEPVPRMGGVAMLGGLLVALLAVFVGMCVLGWADPFVPHPSLKVNYIGVGAGVLFMFAVGVVDDVVDLKPKTKLAGQVAAACIVVASGLLLSSVRNPFGAGFLEFGWFSYPLTVFYLVAFANVINLIDGLDGLAAGITAISAFTLFAFAVLTFRPDAAIMSIALAGVCVGFLRYNFHPASIFMGDSGALLLGFSLGIVSLFAVARSAAFVSLLVPLLAAGVPIIDTALAIVRRTRAHKPIDQADSGHIHHRLMETGFSQRATTLIMWGWTAVLALCGVLITRLSGMGRIVVFCIAAGVTAYGVLKLHLLDPVLLHHYHPWKKTKRGRADGDGRTDEEAGGSDSEGGSGRDENEGAGSGTPRS